MNLTNYGAAPAMDKTRQEIDHIDAAIAVYRAVSFYCQANDRVSPYTKRELEAIVNEIAAIKKRDKVSIRRALTGYKATHLNDPRSDIFDASKVKYWKRKVRAGLKESCAATSLEPGDVV